MMRENRETAMQALERTITCPQCSRPVRLTEHELETKRGFCAACDARFDLGPEMFVHDGPMRSLVVPPTATLSGPPTPKIVELAEERCMALVVYPIWSRAMAIGPILFGAALLGLGAWGVGQVDGAICLFLAGIAAALPCWRWEQITIGKDELTYGRRRGLLFHTRNVRLDLIETISMSDQGRRKIIRISMTPGSGEGPIVVGGGLGHGPEAMAWLRARLERELERFRSLPSTSTINEPARLG